MFLKKENICIPNFAFRQSQSKQRIDKESPWKVRIYAGEKATFRKRINEYVIVFHCLIVIEKNLLQKSLLHFGIRQKLRWKVKKFTRMTN